MNIDYVDKTPLQRDKILLSIASSGGGYLYLNVLSKIYFSCQSLCLVLYFFQRETSKVVVDVST
jgi:hypothetical protein